MDSTCCMILAVFLIPVNASQGHRLFCCSGTCITSHVAQEFGENPSLLFVIKSMTVDQFSNLQKKWRWVKMDGVSNSVCLVLSMMKYIIWFLLWWRWWWWYQQAGTWQRGACLDQPDDSTTCCCLATGNGKTFFLGTKAVWALNYLVASSPAWEIG